MMAQKASRLLVYLLVTSFVAGALITGGPVGAGATALAARVTSPKVQRAVHFDRTPPLREMRSLRRSPLRVLGGPPRNVGERGDDGPATDRRWTGDAALRSSIRSTMTAPAPLFTFEGPSNQDNFNTFGFRVNPPDPNGDVGRRHYVAMVNLVFAVYSKQGQLLFGPVDTGTLWQGFAVDECTEPSGDPIVLYDEVADRWILTQFTTRGLPPDPPNPFYNCVAVSQTGDPTGAYYRFAFTTDDRFPDYPKYGIWPGGDEDDDDRAGDDRDDDDGGGSLTITAREFANQGTGPESIGIYAIDREGLLEGDPETQMVSFQLTGPPNLVGDGLLPADFDGRRLPPEGRPQVILGSQDDGAADGAAFDALNVFHLKVDFDDPKDSTFKFVKHVPIAPFDTIYPCAPTSRDCLPQPGIVNPAQYLDILSYRQRPMWRLQYRNFGRFESLVTNQSVEARPATAGIRWWELRNPRNPVLYQEGTWAPLDGVHRWMGSVALDRRGNMALGYSVVNATDVFPGIRYAGRLATDPLGQLSQGETVLQAGSGVQTTTNSRWGDYTSMNVDPSDDCTFWYINEYYTAASQATSTAGWLTRISVFRFPNCR